MTWTSATVQRLRDLWAEGHPTAEIARRLGVSKNAIVGKVHRLGLPARPSPIKRDVPVIAAPARVQCPENTLPPMASEVPRAKIHQTPGVKPNPITDAMHARIVAALTDGRGTRAVALQEHISERRIVAMRDALRRAKLETVEVDVIRSVSQTALELIVVPRPMPVLALPAWVSRPIPPARSCQWLDGERRAYVQCGAPVVAVGNPYCACHAARAYVDVVTHRKVAA